MKPYQFSDIERTVLENSLAPFAIYQFLDKKVKTLILTQGFLKLFGYTDREKAYYDMDNNMYVDTHPEDKGRVANDAYNFATKGEKYEVIYRTKIKDSTDYKIIHSIGEHYYAPDGTRLAIVSYTDEGTYDDSLTTNEDLIVKFHTALHTEIESFRTYYDYLTGLPTMTYFFELADIAKPQIIEAGGVPALLFIDLNGLSYFNRKFGFKLGDKLLTNLGKILSEVFGTERSGHLGGDNFVVVSEKEGLEEKVHLLFDKWKDACGDNFISLKIGIYLDDFESVSAGVACDRAKMASNALKGHFESEYRFFDRQLLKTFDNQQYIIDNFNRALEEGWIQVYYQPIIRASNDHVCDEEALARWIDPEKGFLIPADFIPILENTNLIYKLDLYVIEEVLNKMRILEDHGLPIVPCSINISRTDFDCCDIVEEICKRCDDAGIGHDKITIEITESMIGYDFEFIKKQAQRFRSLGFKIWIDDFGSGYSSLDVLQSMEFDLIKFDMRFMQEFDQGDNAKIILTELMEMVAGLKVESLCEGVETDDQVEFLKEIGCTKMQGFYYERPISLQGILEKYREGRQIGFENLDETDYYDAIGRINLYDVGMVTNNEQDNFQHYFNSIPMAIVEYKDNKLKFVRTNQAYRDFMEQSFGAKLMSHHIDYVGANNLVGQSFIDTIRRCCVNKNRTLIDEKITDTLTAHSFVKWLATNEITGVSAAVVAVLAITNDEQNVTYANIARALAADYFNIFYVNLDTEHFIEYSSERGTENIALEKHGEDFFNNARKDALTLLYYPDREPFVKAFTKENILNSIEHQGTFTFIYRLMDENQNPVYVSMKAMMMDKDSKYLIIGVSNVDVQMKERENLQKMNQEKLLYSRLAALAGNYLCTYTIDLNTGKFIEYGATEEFNQFGIAKEGEDFFIKSINNGLPLIPEEEHEMYISSFNKENVLKEISEKGYYTLKYHLRLGVEYKSVVLRGAIVKENGEDKLIIGIKTDD